MISRITGIIDEISENEILVRAEHLSYTVYIPTAVMKSLDGTLQKNATVSFVTYHYYQTDPSKSIPVLIGFSNLLEREFFEKFITVSGVGPKAAVKALSIPIAQIAEAIDAGDLEVLRSLPGIGPQRAREIVAKLQGKMAKFGLIRGSKDSSAKTAAPKDSLRAEAMEVLLQLQYKKEEASQMLERVFSRRADLKNVEDVLSEVYRQKKGGS